MERYRASNSLAIVMTYLTILCTMVCTGCSSRLDPVVGQEESTVLYSPKDTTDLDVLVQLYKGRDEAGRQLISNTFTSGERSKVYASIKLLNRELHPGRDVMVHIDWINPDGNSFFMKREDIAADDTVSEICSIISIPADRRENGKYKLRVYLFRELAVETNFTIVNYNADSAAVFPKDYSHPVSAVITLDKTINHNDGMSGDTIPSFEIKNKSKVFAAIKFFNKEFYKGKEFSGEIKWCDNEDKPFYSKNFSILPFDTTTEVGSAISANNKSRESGNYSLKVYLYNRLITEKRFRLVPEKKEELRIAQIKGIDADIIFCSKVGKKTKKAFGIRNNFIISPKGKVHAVISIIDTRIKSINSTIRIEWISPDNSSFYHKTFKFGPNNISTVLSNSVSVTKRREPGMYKCRVYYNMSLIAENSFTLNQP